MPITVVGLGLDFDNLPPKSLARIDAAQVLAGGDRQLQHFARHPAEKLRIAAPLSAVLESINEHDRAGREVVVLATGDPLYFGIGATLVKELGAGRVEVLPNVSALQVAAARTRIPWHDLAMLSLHGKDSMQPLFEALMRRSRVAVLTDARSIPAAIAQALLDKGAANYRMWVFEELESERERLEVYDLETASHRSFSSLNMVILERTSPPANTLCLGIPDEHFAAQGGVLTKWPVRAAGLAALRLTPGNLLWDLGAGCGALAIEAAAVLSSGQVLAVEKRSDRVALIRENIRRCHALLVEAVHGTMPRCLDELPDPDRVFIGGGLSRAPGIFEEACRRLRPGGRIVAHCILLDTMTTVRQALEAQGWKYEVTLLHAAQSSPLGKDMYLQGQNPVFIIGADKPQEG